MVTDQFENELLQNILPFWATVVPDSENGGFFGQIDIRNKINNEIPRTAVTCARILWTFSHAYLIYKKNDYRDIAKRAFDYLNSAFWDKEYGGLYWSVDKHGKPVSSHKHFYAQAFGIYGFSEFSRIDHNEKSLSQAIRLFNLLEEHSFDPVCGGYIEARSRDFLPISDMRLSEKDLNCRKSMNTNLHILEAYSNLYSLWQDAVLKTQLCNLISIFAQHIFNKRSEHLDLFFDADWKSQSDAISCGHDIESSWLLDEAAKTVGDPTLIKTTHQITSRLANSVLQSGVDADGCVIQEGTVEKTTNPIREWWAQNEAVIGFYNAYQLSGEEKFFKASLTCWKYLQEHFIDKEYGGWFKRVTETGAVDDTSPKAGPWECPYHESRMCFEMVQRMNEKEK